MAAAAFVHQVSCYITMSSSVAGRLVGPLDHILPGRGFGLHSPLCPCSGFNYHMLSFKKEMPLTCIRNLPPIDKGSCHGQGLHDHGNAAERRFSVERGRKRSMEVSRVRPGCEVSWLANYRRWAAGDSCLAAAFLQDVDMQGN